MTGVIVLKLIKCNNYLPDSVVNPALTEDAIFSGNAPEGGRAIPADILWDASGFL